MMDLPTLSTVFLMPPCLALQLRVGMLEIRTADCPKVLRCNDSPSRRAQLHLAAALREKWRDTDVQSDRGNGFANSRI